MCDDKNCKSAKSMCDDKNCQSTKSIHMQPVKSAMNLTICGQLNQQYYNLGTRNIVMKSVKLGQYLCVMTRTVNLLNVHICRE